MDITENIISNYCYNRYSEIYSNINFFEKLFDFVKFYIKGTSFSTRSVETQDGEDIFIKIPNLIAMRDYYFKGYDNEDYYPSFIENNTNFTERSYGSLPNYFSINQETGELCLLSFGLDRRYCSELLDISPNITGSPGTFSDRDKKILIHSLKKENEKYPYVVSTFDTPDLLNESGRPKTVNKFKDLSDILFGENSGLDIYFQFVKFLFDVDYSHKNYLIEISDLKQ
jgi:hypothetical protein